jgi:hypothetical protein
MRTTVIPAQITTVEDKIAGNLNLTQIFILMIPVFWTTIVYAIFPLRMRMEWYKLPLILTVLILCLILSLRIKGKVVLNWLIVLIRYNLRPKYYLFNKNDTYLRALDLPQIPKRPYKLPEFANFQIKSPFTASSIRAIGRIKLRSFIKNPKYTLSLKPNKKGGLYVGLEQIGEQSLK